MLAYNSDWAGQNRTEDVDLKDRRMLVRWGFAALLIVSVAQVAWWMLDLWWFSSDVAAARVEHLEHQALLANTLIATGASLDSIRELGLHVEFRNGVFVVPEARLGQVQEDRRRRLNRYAWEGGFFLLVLCGALVMIASVLRHESRLRRRQQNFLAAVSHEFKNPITAARLAAQTVERQQLEGAEREVQTGRVVTSLDRLDAMVDNLLDSARIQEGAVDLAVEPRQVLPTLERVCAPYLLRADVQGIRLETRWADECEALVDDVALATIVRNLLENAFQAVGEATDPHVELEAEREGHRVVLSVRDNGVGFEPRHASDLFLMFYRPGDEMRRSGRGAGLGLHIVRALVESMGGHVGAHSEGPGRGAEFIVRLRAAEE